MPHELAYMSREELYPEKWHLIIEKEKLKLKEAYEIKQVSMSDLIKCGKCKNNKVSYQELQNAFWRRIDDNFLYMYCFVVINGKLN